jgi:hypothetical protein
VSPTDTPKITTLPTPWAIAQGFSCANQEHDVLGADGTTNPSGLDGIQSQIYVPTYTGADLNGQITTNADINMVIIDDHYFQFGWYVGHTTSGLSYVNTPHLWAGEGNLNPNSQWETLTELAPIAGGTFATFSLYRVEDSHSGSYNHYVVKLNGGPVLWTSAMANSYSGDPRMVGESNFDCASLWGYAATPTNGPTLQLHHAGGSWAMWQQHVNVAFGNPAEDPGCWVNGRVNGLGATVDAFPTCSG